MCRLKWRNWPSIFARAELSASIWPEKKAVILRRNMSTLFTTFSGENFNITIHAGEGYGKESIWQAIQYCGAHRIGHGTRLIDDIAVVDGKAVKLGDLAQYVLDKRIPLEICLLSNVHTGATPSLAEHPFKILYQEKFRVTLNTDNRLMSSTTHDAGVRSGRGYFWFVPG